MLCKGRFHLPCLQECCEWNTEIIKLVFPCQLGHGLGIWYIDELGRGHFGCSALLRLFDLPLSVLSGHYHLQKLHISRVSKSKLPRKRRRVKSLICITTTLTVHYGFGRFLILRVTISILAAHCLPLLLVKHLQILKKTYFIAGNKSCVNDVSKKNWSETCRNERQGSGSWFGMKFK